jgi:hypothetical protein
MNVKRMARWGLALAICLGAGCGDGGGSDEDAGYRPAIDANGDWSVQADGAGWAS